MIKDPVCGMELGDKRVVFKYNGKKYFFCSQGCLKKFKGSPRKFSQNYIYDLIIIGAGPAGLTAAVYASILKVDTCLITKNIGGQAVDSTKIKNYMGFDFIAGKDLIKKFKEQFLHKHYLEHRMDEVISVNNLNGHFEILTKSQGRFLAHSIIISTGMERKRLGVPGEGHLLRKGVSSSYVQDITAFKGLDVVVVGGGNSGIQTANDLKNLGCKVTFVSKGKLIGDQSDINALQKSGKVDILEGYDVIEILGEDNIKGVIIQSQNTLKTKKITCRGVFIQVGFLPNTEFCQDLVKLNRKGEITVKPDCSTNKKGIFACGDVTNAFGKRIIIASGEGAKAALSAKKYLLSKK